MIKSKIHTSLCWHTHLSYMYVYVMIEMLYRDLGNDNNQIIVKKKAYH